MKSNCYLPIRPRPQRTESGLGYVVRLMQANGYRRSTVARDLLGFPSNQTVWGWSFPITELSNLVLGHREELARISYLGTPEKRAKRSAKRPARPGLRAFKILDHSLGGNGGDVHRATSPVVCPECVKEQGFIDAFFDLRVAVACPEHGTLVTRTCPRCKEPVHWTRAGLLTCKCGGDFSTGERAPAPASLVNLLAAIKAKLHGKSVEGVAPEAGFPAECFDRMRLINLLRLVARLGRMKLELLGELRPTEDRIFEAAGDVLGKWPHNFHDFLRQYGEREMARGNQAAGVLKRFSGFLAPLWKKLTGDPARDWLRMEFGKFARENWGVVYDKGVCKGVQGRYLTINAYGRKNGLERHSVLRLIRDGIVTAKIYQAGTRRVTVIDTGAAGRAPGRRDTLSKPAVKRALRMPWAVLTSLRKSGVFRVRDRETLTERSRHWKFWFREDVEAFKQRLLNCSVDQDPGKDAVSFTELMRRGWVKRKAKHAIVAALVDGKIHAVRLAGAGLEGLFLSRREIDELCRGLSRDCYTFKEITEYLGLRADVIEEAIKTGLLVATSMERVRRRVTSESVERFRNERLVLGCLARRLGVDWKRLERICQDLGIEMTSLANSTGGVQLLIPRSREQDVISALRERQEAAERPAETKADRERCCAKLLSRYLEGLKEAGRSLPRRNGKVSQLQVAKACGLSKNVWTSYPGLGEVLRIADLEECKAQGLERPGPEALLRRYLRQLGERDESLPMRSIGKPGPNEWKIGQLVGIDTRWFRSEPSLRKLIQDYQEHWEARHPERLPARAGRLKAVSQQADFRS